MITNNKLLAHLSNNKIPITADIFLTDFCNNKCSYCNYARFGDRIGRYIKFEDFKIYISKLYEFGVRGFILSGGGEPTLNPDFDLICNWLEENKLDYGINTNFNVYKEINPIYLKVSLDAWDKQSYINHRGIDTYEKVITNIKKYIQYKEKNNIDTQIGLQCLVNKITDIEDFWRSIKDLHVDYISFRPSESIQGIFYKNSLNETELIKKEIEKFKNLDNRIIGSYKWDTLDLKFDKCYANYAQIALDFNGNVLICCHRPYDIVGHILEPNILEKKANFKIDMSKCDIPCRLTGPNNCMKMLEGINLFKDKNFI